VFLTSWPVSYQINRLNPMVSLPVELWLSILRYATITPGFLDTSILPPVTNEPRAWIPHHNRSHDAYLVEIRQTQKSIVLVCRLWKDLATAFLYEYVYIQRSKSLPALIETLEHSQTQMSSLVKGQNKTDRRKSSYIKRLDVDFSKSVETTFPPTFVDLVPLFALCDQLEVLVTGSVEQTGPVAEAPYTSYQAPQLRYCQLAWYQLGGWNSSPSATALSKFPEIFEGLEALELTLDDCTVFSPLGSISFPHLHMLELKTVGTRLVETPYVK
jgi:hypothetical protein